MSLFIRAQGNVEFSILGSDIVTMNKKKGRRGRPSKNSIKPNPDAALRRPPTPLQITFARNVLAAREAAGLTQRELARLTGGSQNHVFGVEVEAQNVTLVTVTRYARALGVPELDLLTPKPEES